MSNPRLVPLAPSPWQAMLGLLRRDVRLAFRRKSEWLSGVFFFVLVAALFPLAIGPEPATLRVIGPGVLWVAALLASMLSLGRLFESDHLDGSLEQMALSAAPLSWLVVAKLVADLGSKDFPTRDAATTELEYLGKFAKGELEAAQKAATNAEAKARIAQLEALSDTTGRRGK